MSLNNVTAGPPSPAPRPGATPRRRAAAHGPRAVALASLASLLAPSPLGAVEPDAKQACANAFPQAQRLRRAGKLIDARREAKVCASDVCSSVVQRECVQIVAELDRAIPSIILRVRDSSGRETVDAKLSLDDKPLAAPTAGLAVDVDPGIHVIEVSYKLEPPQRQEILLYEGDKSRPVNFSFGKPEEPAPAKAAPPPAPPAPPTPPRPEGKRGPPALAYVLGGVGVAGVAGFAALGLSARSKLDELEKDCGHECPSGQVDPVRRRALYADLSLGAGIVSLGFATYLFLSDRRPPAKSATAVDAFALPGGGAVTLRQSF